MSVKDRIRPVRPLLSEGTPQMTWRIEYPAAPRCECGDGDKHRAEDPTFEPAPIHFIDDVEVTYDEFNAHLKAKGRK